MKSNQKIKWIIFLIVLTLTTISCGFFDSFVCVAAGGKWVPKRYRLGQPYDPADEDYVCEKNIDQEKYDTWRYGKQNGSDQDSQIKASTKDCQAPREMYWAEFENKNNDGTNKTKEVCQGDFVLKNLSDEILTFYYYRIWNNGAMETEGWRSYGSLNPGDSSEKYLYYGTQRFKDGREPDTLETYTKLFVHYASPECGGLINLDSEALWSSEAIDLKDPCSYK